jgi:hypothetical protein
MYLVAETGGIEKGTGEILAEVRRATHNIERCAWVIDISILGSRSNRRFTIQVPDRELERMAW